ncbi:DUF2846 domain-containing protein [Spirosoma oryzicola]|uniref:DUF2846 domain-containing protein n=1 Tax=Spirosoma oryzicola TaxID=2898794 RepID=UPI001E317F5F|nr:DUF2846 domain-containing protein [Spirosoma oryzicola]UHG94639.1 DUF2846 domain-containing protein [Spirosoma oryzicola]
MNRNKVALILLFFSISQTMLFAQSQQTAVVHLYQGKVFGLFSAKYRVYADGKLICKLGRNSHCQISLPAGKTRFTTKPPLLGIGPQPALTLALEPGKEYYLQGDIKSDLFPPNSALVLTEVVANSSKLEQIIQAKVAPALSSSVD